MVAAQRQDEREAGRLQRGARGRYTPPPQLFPLAMTEVFNASDGRLTIERDAEGGYVVRERDTGRLVARTADSATLQRLLTTLAKG